MAREDIWGVRREKIVVPTPGGQEVYKDIAVSPLASASTVEQIDLYGHWPSVDWFDYSTIKSQCDAVRRIGRVAVFMGDRLNRVSQLKAGMYVRGMEQMLIERGLDVLQSIQPEARDMYPRELKGEFGDRLSFHGGISIQQTMPFGSREDVRNEVRDRIEALAPRDGYIFSTSHNIQADTPLENFRELLRAHKAYGSYS